MATPKIHRAMNSLPRHGFSVGISTFGRSAFIAQSRLPYRRNLTGGATLPESVPPPESIDVCRPGGCEYRESIARRFAWGRAWRCGISARRQSIIGPTLWPESRFAAIGPAPSCDHADHPQRLTRAGAMPGRQLAASALHNIPPTNQRFSVNPPLSP